MLKFIQSFNLEKDMSIIVDQLIQPSKIANRDEVLARPSIVPNMPGIYAWFFKTTPSSEIDIKKCWEWNKMHLLYVGISPKRPSLTGKPPSRQNLRKRIRCHMRGTAYGSTLRLSLGCLLSESLGIQLCREGSGTRLTFSSGEELLSRWMSDNAFVAWIPHPEPWIIEEIAIARLYLPLNLDQNSRHPFYPFLSNARKKAKERARLAND